MRCIRLGLIVLALSVGAAEATPSNLPLSAEVMAAPMPVKADGLFHAAYEMRLTNFGRIDLTLRAIDVTDAAGVAALAHYDGQALIDALRRPGLKEGADKR